MKKKIFFLNFFFFVYPPLWPKKFFFRKNFFSTFGFIIINVWPKAKKKCIFFSVMFMKNFGNDVAKCLTKIEYYMRHFASLLRKFFHVNGRKKASFFHFRTYILFFKVRFEKKVGQFSCSSYPPLRFLDEKSSTPIEKKMQKN